MAERRIYPAIDIAKSGTRKEEKLMMLGPVLESLHGDLLKPLVDWAFEEMFKHNLFDPPPRELEGWPIEIELIVPTSDWLVRS